MFIVSFQAAIGGWRSNPFDCSNRRDRVSRDGKSGRFCTFQMGIVGGRLLV